MNLANQTADCMVCQMCSVCSKKRQYDPIDYECIDKVEFWVIDENANEELDYEELEEMLDEEQAKGDEDDIMVINDDEIDLSRFDDDGNTGSINDGFCDLSCIKLEVGNESD
ncbi:uncharacterized protein LOC121778593 [Salvia splendens]|uniref:uncharacterized protein LOC121778593 n=1 Tax=Salvia splendens TaxID=180675 RepID=UPI001C26376A|nr:uncharacterized protein LOC121778593 [Salvia splendens]